MIHYSICHAELVEISHFLRMLRYKILRLCNLKQILIKISLIYKNKFKIST